jgi:hypothetical protein
MSLDAVAENKVVVFGWIFGGVVGSGTPDGQCQ